MVNGSDSLFRGRNITEFHNLTSFPFVIISSHIWGSFSQIWAPSWPVQTIGIWTAINYLAHRFQTMVSRHHYHLGSEFG